MAALRWQSICDFLVLTLAIYLVLRGGKEARAFRVSLAIVALKAAALLAQQLDLVITGLILDAANLIAIILLVIVYQAELRRAVTRLDFLAWLAPRHKTTDEAEPGAIGAAAFSLARAQCGALIVITRRDPLDELIDGGVGLGGDISPEILEAIFRKESPVHDGATIVEGDRIVRVGALLPLTRRTDIPQKYGTRHRSALGLAEHSDAVITVVSEERGDVSLIYGRTILKVDTAEELSAKIRELEGPRHVGRAGRVRQALFGNLALKFAALSLAIFFWGIAFFLVGNSIRTVTVPVEFSNVPANEEIFKLSSNTVQVQVRGSAWLLDSVSLNTLVARFDLTDRKQGSQTISVARGSLDLPPGLVIQDISPGTISLDLEPVGRP